MQCEGKMSLLEKENCIIQLSGFSKEYCTATLSHLLLNAKMFSIKKCLMHSSFRRYEQTVSPVCFLKKVYLSSDIREFLIRFYGILNGYLVNLLFISKNCLLSWCKKRGTYWMHNRKNYENISLLEISSFFTSFFENNNSIRSVSHF